MSVMIRRNRKQYKRSAAESVAEIQKLLSSVRKTDAEVVEVLRMRESSKALTLALPPVCLAPEPVIGTAEKRSAPVGFPASYLEKKK